MKHPGFPILLLLGALGCVLPARAAGLLRWERDSIDVAARPGQRVVHVDFPFSNCGDKPVTIVSVETSCRCTSADSSKTIYAPGEKDAIGVDFTVGGQEGVVVKSVTVTTDGSEPTPFTLTLRVTIPGSGAPR
jgi:hypothetical protein